MMKTHIVLIIILSLVMPFTGSSQSLEEYKYFEIDAIASKELIKSVCKDSQGFIWLATDQGVLRYDGKETRLYYKELPSPYTKGFLKTKSGKFLVIHDFGIKQIVNNPDTTYFSPILLNNQNEEIQLAYPKSIFEDSKRNIWIGEFTSIARINDDGFRRFELGEPYRSISYHRTFSFAEDAFGNVWIAPYKGKLLTYNKVSDNIEPIKLEYPITNATAIVSVKGDHLLIGGREGVLKLKVDSDKNILSKEFLPNIKDVSSAFTLNENEVLVGTWTDGLYLLELNSNRYQKINIIPFNDIIGFDDDKENGEVWVVGSENIGLFKRVGVKTFKNVGQNRIEAIDVDKKGNIYYSLGQQIFKLSEGNSDQKIEEVLSSRDTYFDRILLDGNDLWIGDAFGSIFKYNLDKKEIKTFQDKTNNSIKHIYKDNIGNKWFSGHPSSVTRIDENQKIHYYNVPNSAIIKQSPLGTIICGIYGPNEILYYYDKIRDDFAPIRVEFMFDKTENVQVEDMVFDKDNNIYLATDVGLLKVNFINGSYKTIERLVIDGFDENEPARAIYVHNDIFWIANSFGLVVFQEAKSVVYTTENGMPSKILKERGFVMGNDNNLLIATAKGLAQVKTEIRKLKNASVPFFKLLEVNGEKHKLLTEEKSIFPYNAKLHAEFVSLLYPGTDIVYQTRILGLDDNWSKPSSNHSISVLGFPEGQFTLEVRSRDGGFQWSEPLAFQFEVRNPWFRTWWAYVLFLLLLSFFTYISVRFYNQHLIRQKRKLQKIIEERTAEINRQKNEIIEQKNKIILQKEELLEKNKVVYESQHALSEADLKFLHLKEKQLQDQIEFKNKQITTHTLNIIQKNTTLNELRNKLEEIVKSPNGVLHNELKKSLKIIDESFKLDKDWEDFKLYFEQVYTGFYSKLKINYPELTTQELRHCALIRLNLSISECATILGISPDSIKVSRTRLRKKLHIPNNGSLSDFILSI